MKRHFSLTCITLILSYLSSHADILTTKDGRNYKGKLLRETADSYVFKVQVTKSIKEERTFKKEEVETLERDDPAELAYKSISKLRTTPDMLPLADYDRHLETISSFIKEHKDSEYVARVKPIQSRLKDEREKVAKGERKLNGTWFSIEDQQMDAYKFDGLTLIHQIEQTAENKQTREALNLLETFEQDYLGSGAADRAMEIKKELLTKYSAEIETDITESAILVENRKKGIAKLSKLEKKRTMKAVEEESMVYMERVKSAKKKKIRWIPLNPYSVKELEEQLKEAKEELKRLTSIDTFEINDSGTLYKNALTAAKGGDITEAKRIFDSLKSEKIPQKYLETLSEALSMASKKVKENAKSEAVAAE